LINRQRSGLAGSAVTGWHEGPYCGAVATQVIVLNGGSSAGKSGIAAMAGAGTRIMGMAAAQADVVHQSVVYDLQVDTTHTEAWECAQAIAARVH
jgi:chloramphenicol 3-O-phosphotransferase